MRDQDNDMNQTIGILGAGQLGKMLYLAGANMALDIALMDKSVEMPAGKISKNYFIGDFTNYDDVLAFGRDKDIITIEIENINVEALKELEKGGKTVYPQADIIELIQDKGLQKDFYKNHKFPASNYKKYNSKFDLERDLLEGAVVFPFVQKMRKGGYDGRGVQIIRNQRDMFDSFSSDFIIESLVKIKKEISVVTCRSADGEIVTYDPVEMVFDPQNHILLYQIGPAEISEQISNEAMEMASCLSEQLGIVGLLAIEMFITTDDQILINECAPRPHNSGHHSIEACHTSQYENQLRALLHLPLGSTKTIINSILYNVLGEEGFTGPVIFNGLKDILAIEGVNVHIYGKEETKPFRKMGHITIIDNDKDSLLEKYNIVSTTLNVIS